MEVKCTRSINGRFKVGKVYSLNENGSITDEDGNAGYRCRTDSFEHWHEDAQWTDYDFELVKESKMFTKDDLKVGYVLELDNDSDDVVMVLPYRDGLCISGPKSWFPISLFNNDLIYLSRAVTKVYGLARPADASKIDTTCRELIWKRNAVKEISVEEATRLLTEKFGQSVRIRVGE